MYANFVNDPANAIYSEYFGNEGNSVHPPDPVGTGGYFPTQQAGLPTFASSGATAGLPTHNSQNFGGYGLPTAGSFGSGSGQGLPTPGSFGGGGLFSRFS